MALGERGGSRELVETAAIIPSRGNQRRNHKVQNREAARAAIAMAQYEILRGGKCSPPPTMGCLVSHFSTAPDSSFKKSCNWSLRMALLCDAMFHIGSTIDNVCSSC